jgi:crotonobetainyl-CoA:carnitine CoA-transferase CaiB-like acyl-CoA transferase
MTKTIDSTTPSVERLRDGAPLNARLPLEGVRVLDLGQVFQGPYAGFLMAMAGAEVFKIEPPHGDMSRRRGRDGDYPFRALNGNKRGIVLNLKPSVAASCCSSLRALRTC